MNGDGLLVSKSLSSVTVSKLQAVITSGYFFKLTDDASVTLSQIFFYSSAGFTTSVISATAGSVALDHVYADSFYTNSAISLFSFTGISSLSISDCGLSRITTGASPIRVSITSASGTDSSVTFKDTYFIQCSTTGNGGALSLSVEQGATLSSLVFTTENGYSSAGAIFEGCSAKQGKGGALYLDIEGTLTNTPTQFLLLFRSSSTAQSGDEVYVKTNSPSVRSFVQTYVHSFPNGWFENYKNAVVLEYTSGGDTDTFNLGELANAYYILSKEEGTSAVACTASGHICATFTNVGSLIYSESYQSLPSLSSLILVDKGTHEAESMVSIPVSLYIAGRGAAAEDTKLKLGNNAVSFSITAEVYFDCLAFEITSGFQGAVTTSNALYITNCYFYGSGASISYSVITTSGDTLSLVNTRFASLTTTVSLLYLTQNAAVSLYLTEASFTDITRTTGAGSVIEEYTPSALHSITIEGSMFKNCKAKDEGGAISISDSSNYVSLSVSLASTSKKTTFQGCVAGNGNSGDSYGGAIYYACSGSYSYSNTPRVAFGNVEFSSNTATYGSAIYISTSSFLLLACVTYLTSPQDQTGKYVASVTDTTLHIELTNVDIFKYVPVRGYLSANGQTAGCGLLNNNPCKTFAQLFVSLQYAKQYVHISLDGTTHPTEQTRQTLAGTVEGTTNTVKLVDQVTVGDGKNYCYMIEQFYTAHLKQFTLRASTSADTFSSCMIGVMGTLTLTNMRFEQVAQDSQVAPFTNSVLYVDGGSVTFSSVTFSSFQLSDCPLLHLHQSSTSTSSCTGSATFKSITRRTGSGAVFSFCPKDNTRSADYPVSFEFNDMSFEDCTCVGGNGGAIYVEVYSGDMFDFHSLTFKNCKAVLASAATTASGTQSHTLAHANAAKAASVGGGIYVYVKEVPIFRDGIQKTELVDQGGNSADYGSLFFAGSEEEDVSFDWYIWDDFHGQVFGKNQYVVGVMSYNSQTGAYEVDDEKVKEMSQISSPADPDDGLSGAVIAVIVIVVIVVVAAVVIIIICCCRNKSSDESSGSNSDNKSSANTSQQPEQELAYPAN